MTTSETDLSAHAVEQARQFDLFDDSRGDGVYEVYSELRAKCPVAHSEQAGGFWLVTGYDEAIKCLKDVGTFSSASGNAIPPVEGRKWLPAYVDPPEHTNYRRDLNYLFAPPRVRPHEAESKERALSYVRALVEDGGGDALTGFCGPFPCSTFLLQLGAPVEDTDMLVHWKDTLIGAIGDAEIREHLFNVVNPAMKTYFNRLLDEREADPSPPDDVLTGLTRATVGDRRYTRDEMLRACGFFVLAGLDTVTSVLARVLHHLATHPDDLAQLVAEPALIPAAVEEFGRYFAPVSTGRRVTIDTEFAGQQLAAGDWVMVSTVSASRDEQAFEHADRIDFRRPSNKHLGFGAGPHRCLGSHLARMELKVALEAVVELMPRFGLDPAHEARMGVGPVYGMEQLHLLVQTELSAPAR